MKIEVNKELLVECFALLGAARFDSIGLNEKQTKARKELIELIKSK